MKAKKFLAVAISLAMMCAGATVSYAETEAGEGTQTALQGDGTQTSPYLVSSLEEFKQFRDNVNAGTSYNGKYIKLTSNINLASEENWTPIGNNTNAFEGHFDGDNKTVSNLKVNRNEENTGLFGFTKNGSLKNLTINNADIDGDLNVGALAGCPYTSKVENINLTGKVTVDGRGYVGGVAGKNAYNSLKDIVVNVTEDSYVKANSYAPYGSGYVYYRSYVGGVIGFCGEGNITHSNITSNIDVEGTACDVGGITGIAHYGNTFKNVTCTGDVTLTNADGLADAKEVGGIAGVWNNGGADVTFENCTYRGTVKSSYTSGENTVALTKADFENNGLIGKSYSTSGNGKLIIRSGAANLNDIIENAGFEVDDNTTSTVEVVTVDGSKIGDNGVTFDYTIKDKDDKTYNAPVTFNTKKTEATGNITFGIFFYNIPEGATVGAPTVSFN